MKTVTGVFTSIADAQRAAGRLRTIGVSDANINMLMPGASKDQIKSVPTTEGEQPGMGKAVGAVVGGATGAALSPLGQAAVTALIPGIGPVAAVGILAATLVGGAFAGAAVGGAFENALDQGLPKDELYIYEDALRQGRTVLIALVEDESQYESAHAIISGEHAETIDAARDQWWIGLRDVEEEAYSAHGGDFRKDEAEYRRGFEAAQQIGIRGKSYEEALEYLRAHNPELYRKETFRRGYERGREHYLRLK